jgi:trimeric autotransporter adhesin
VVVSQMGCAKAKRGSVLVPHGASARERDGSAVDAALPAQAVYMVAVARRDWRGGARRILMRRTGIERSGLVAVMAMVCAGSACEARVGIEEMTVASVRGTAVGVLAPLGLRLEFTGGSEVLRIAEDGEFAFESTLDEGDSYAVALVGEPPCVLQGATGVITNGRSEIALTCEGVVRLASLAISGPSAPDLGFSPDTLEYVVEVSLLQQSTTVTATAAYPEASITVNGTSVTSGAPSAPLVLPLLDTIVHVRVTHPRGFERGYQVTIRRAGGKIAQYAYGKASNTGSRDYFGYSVALDGDTLAVGAYLEDSAATGVNGNQADDSAAWSGAVYVFRRSGTGWVQEAYVKASNTGVSDGFGHSVALDGDTLAVGAPGEKSAATGVNGNQADDSAGSSGAVYVFRRSGTVWQQEAYVKASNTGTGDFFGDSVALDGDTLAVGAYLEDSAATGINDNEADNSATNSGAVYIFH